MRAPALLLAALLLAGGAAPAATSDTPRAVEYVDPARGRRIPVALYGAVPGTPKPLAVISNGYGGRNTAYGFIAEALVARGFAVAAIQQDLPTDPPMATEGDLKTLRRPFWQAGADSILFAAEALRREGIADASPLVLVGHSNGGDIGMLFAAQHPAMVRAVFSLDNRRMDLPRTSAPRVCTVRSSDLPADPGVLPDPEEARRHRILVAQVPGLRHNDMWDKATTEQKAAVLGHLAACLEG